MSNMTRVVLVLISLLAGSCGVAAAQQAPTIPEPPSLSGPFNANPPGMSNGEMGGSGRADAQMLKQMAKQRNVIRQKEIVDDTERLLDLAKQLKTAVDKSNKDELSLSVVSTAAEIEKLAKEVKEKMRDGQ